MGEFHGLDGPVGPHPRAAQGATQLFEPLHQALEGLSRGRGTRRLRQEECLASERTARGESARPTSASSCRTRRWSPGSTHSALTRSSRHPSPTSVAPRRRRHEDCLALHCSARICCRFPPITRAPRTRTWPNASCNSCNIARSAPSLIDNPYLGHPSESTDGMHELQVARLPYFLPYRVVDGRIEILRIFHESQERPSAWESDDDAP